MLFSKSFFVLLLILGTSWFASACGSSSPPRQQSPKQERGRSIYDIPNQPDGEITAGLWVGKEYFRLPDASFYKLEFKKGESVSSSLVTNPFRPMQRQIIFQDQHVRFN